jgi:hypothetical protein
VNELHELHDFFAASVGSAAALIGLLFVAISLAPEKVFGLEAHPHRRANAERTFTALVNVFFVSLVALLPHSQNVAIGIVAVVSMAQTLRVGIEAFRRRPQLSTWRHTGILSLVAFAFEYGAAHGMGASGSFTDDVVYVVLGLYLYALITSWGLLRPGEAPPAAGA